MVPDVQQHSRHANPQDGRSTKKGQQQLVGSKGHGSAWFRTSAKDYLAEDLC